MKPFYYLSDFPERRRAGKNYIAECPKCGKKHLAISRDTGLYCCFYAGCDFHGKLKDFWTERRSTGWQDAGSPAELGRIFSLYGPDSSQGIFASVFMGSTETIFYTVPVYLSAARLKSSPKAIIISLISMLAGLVTALLILNLS